MAFNQTNIISNPTIALPPLPLNRPPQVMSSQVNNQPQQQPPPPDHFYPFSNPNNEAPPLAIPFSSMTHDDLLSNLSSELNNHHAAMEAYLHCQNETMVNTIMSQYTKQSILLQNYAGLICEKEKQLMVANHTILDLNKCIMDLQTNLAAWQQIAMEKETIVANLGQQLQTMIQENDHQVNNNTLDACSSCGDHSPEG